MKTCFPLVAVAIIAVAACSDSPTGDVAGPTDVNTASSTAPQPPAMPVIKPSSGTSLFAGARLWVDPDSRPAQQAAAWRTSRPADAALMDRMAAQPQVIWIGDWNPDSRSDVAEFTADVVRAGALPVYVAYNIPVRDCGSYSAGGASSASSYRSWIRGFVAGLGMTKSVVILEPDAIAGSECLNAAQEEERYALLRDAVDVLTGQGSAVYIDAGNPAWMPPAEIAAKLVRAGIANAAGFALNVSNFMTTSDNTAYGASISSLVGGKHFVIDTSRNGRGPAANMAWCNPAGRGLGEKPTTQTNHPLVDALLWIKSPGESDGECNGGPSAGEWWGSYALGLAQRAVDL